MTFPFRGMYAVRMEAVFQLKHPIKALQPALVQCLDRWNLRAQPLDPSGLESPVAGWFRIESDSLETLQAGVAALLKRDDVDGAYIKPDEGPPG